MVDDLLFHELLLLGLLWLCVILYAQFIAVCSRSKWSKPFTHSPRLALLAIVGSNAAGKISSACSNAFWCRTFHKH
jgi:hypothetical protein